MTQGSREGAAEYGVAPAWPRSRIVLAAAAALLVVHAFSLTVAQGPACIDDAYISFRYARNLAEGQGLVFNPGEWVEGYTNLGWVLALSLAHRLGLDMPATARAANQFLGALLVVAALAFLARRARRPSWEVTLAGALLVADGSLARWSQDGLETILFALLVLAGAAAGAREIDEPARRPRAWLWFAASAWVRPEGILFFAASLARRAWIEARSGAGPSGRGGAGGGGGRRDLGLALLGFALLVAPLFAWRFATYGALLPNTFYAKVGGTEQQIVRGLRYLGLFLASRWPALALLAAAATTPAGRRLAPWQRHFLWLAAVHAAYVVAVGGDWMGQGRFLVPVLALAYLPLAAAAASSLAPAPECPPAEGSSRPALAAAPPAAAPSRAARRGGAPRIAALAATAGCLWFSSSLLGERPSVVRERAFAESRFAVARFLKQEAKPGERVLTNEIGQIGWVTGLPMSDLHGLTDPHIAHLRVEGMGSGRAGHEKADLDYSFAQDPAWVVIPDIAADFAAYRDTFPPFARYELVLVPETTPRPEYQVVLRRRAGGKAETDRPG